MRAISLFSVGLILFLIGAHSAPGATLPESCRELTAPTGSDGFGRSVSLDGETALVGAYGEDCAAGQDCGAAYVFRFNGTDWVGEAKLTASDADQADSFGWCVSLDGHIALVGAYGEDCAAGQDCGAAYVFRFNGTDWVEEAKLAAADADQADSFGWSVALDGDTAVVGAYGDDCAAGSDCGSAYVFRFDGVNWNQEAKLTAAAAKHGDSFGRSVSLDGGKVLVGAPFDCSDGCGAAYVFGFDGNDWAEEAKLSGDGEFGAAVSIDGERALVGAPAYNIAELPGYSVPAGAVYVFRFDGANWGEEVLRTASDPHYDSSFGASVSLDGEAALVGAPYLEVPPAVINGEYRGAYLFRVYNAEWMGNARLTATDVADEDFVSRSVSLDGDLALIGASDSAYVCTFSFPALANPPMPCPSGSPGDRYSRFGCFGTSFFGGQETAIRVRIAKMYNTNAGDSSGASVCPPGRDGAGLPALEQLEGQVAVPRRSGPVCGQLLGERRLHRGPPGLRSG